MSSTVTAPISPVKQSQSKRLASTLVREFRAQVAQALIDHEDGLHVGTQWEDTNCGSCDGSSGDMPHRDTGITRGEYLERNIVATVALMRLNADLVEFESLEVA